MTSPANSSFTTKDPKGSINRRWNGITIQKNSNGWSVAFLHYSADPVKNTTWVDREMKKYPSLDLWNQEQEIDFTKTTGLRVHVAFDPAIHISPDPLPYLPSRTVYRGWDFGFRRPACIWGQVTETGVFHLLGEHIGNDITLIPFANQVLTISSAHFPGATFEDWGDPAVRQRSDKSEKTSLEKLADLNIRLRYRVGVTVKAGIDTIRDLMSATTDGLIRFKVNATCRNFIDGASGGYIRDPISDEPLKDGEYDHAQDCVRYLVQGIFSERTSLPMRAFRLFKKSRAAADAVTGY